MSALIVVAIVPIAIGVPAASFHIPPAVAMLPAVMPRFRQFAPGMRRLFALPSMPFGGLVQLVIGLDDSFLAIIGPGARRQTE